MIANDKDRFVNINFVIERLGISRATLYRMIANGDFPPCIKLSRRSQRSLWPLALVQKFYCSLVETRAETDKFYMELKNEGN